MGCKIANNLNVQVISLAGDILATFRFEQTMQYPLTINIKDLSDGFYILKITEPGKIYFSKFIKESF